MSTAMENRTGLTAAEQRGGSSVMRPHVRRRSGWGWGFAVILLGGLAGGGYMLYPELARLGNTQADNGALTYTVSQNRMLITVTSDGTVESASNVDVKCRVSGGSTILWIVEDGKVVEEGEEIIRLDTSRIEDELNSQKIVYERALATKIQSQEDLGAATISVKEYEEGTFVEQLQQVEADIRIALENLRSAENQLVYTKKMVRKGFASSLQREADEFAVERAKLDLDAANTKKKVLVEFTKPKTLKELEAKRDAAAARLRADEAALNLEEARLARLQEQLKHCVITAPSKGMVVYAKDAARGRFGGQNQSQIEEGAMVRERQDIVQLPDLTQMQVKVTVHESRVDQIQPGMLANIKIQDQDFHGRVAYVANQPEQSSWLSANVKEYATTVTIEGETKGLRPGMTAHVEILVADLPNVLTVPVSAVVEQNNQFHCWLKTPGGSQKRVLTLGHTNNMYIEVIDGVVAGDQVIRNPRAVVEEAREESPFEEQLQDSQFGDSGPAETGAGRPGIPGADTPTDSSPPPRGEGHGSGPPSAPPGARPQPGGPGNRPPGAGGERGGSGGRGGADLMRLDADGDGRISKDEAPEGMQQFFDRVDSNGDGFLDAGEVAAMRSQRGAGGGGRRRGGGGPSGGGRGAGGPGGGRADGSGGQRP